MFDAITDKKDERTEWLTMHVTPAVKKEFDLAKENKILQDEIIRSHIKSETDWLKQEMEGIDEATLKYRAKLLTIKDNFTEAQSSYIEQVEDIYEVANKTFEKIDLVAKKLDGRVESAYKKVSQLSDKISYINSDRLEKLLNVIDRFSNMSKEEKDLVNLIISKEAG